MMLTKEEIIKEVQKWAKENGDQTPSGKILREEIGIPKSEWINYWIKTSDIQRDAGLTPHGFKNKKYPKKELCDKFIKSIREKGKWPTRDELEFKRRHDSGFPASVTFYERLGLVETGELAQTILEYIKDKQGYDDVVNICNSVLEKNKNEGKTSEDDKVESGFVYLGKRGKHYRIGRAKNLDQRRNDHNLNQLEYFDYIHTIETDDMVHIEHYWHKRFASKCIKGEWFKLNSSDVKAFKRWKRIF